MTVLFPGSFHPFTKGHADIVERALGLFDEVVIAIGVNVEKTAPQSDAAEAHHRLKAHYADNPKVRVIEYSGLTADLCKELQIKAIIRGVRSMKDYEYEKQMADINRQLTGVETLLLFANPAYESLSSSMVRELAHYGKDVSSMII